MVTRAARGRRRRARRLLSATAPVFLAVFASVLLLLRAPRAGANTVFTFWESSEFISRDQRPTCDSGDLVRIEVTYNFQACFSDEIRNTEEEENGIVCWKCTSDFMKYEQAISPCLADNDNLKQMYTEEYNEWITTCPCYIAGRNGKPACSGASTVSLSATAAIAGAALFLALFA